MTQPASIPSGQVQVTFANGTTTFQSVGDQYYATPLDITAVCAGPDVSANVYISSRDGHTETFLVRPGECENATVSGQTISRVSVNLAEPTPAVPPDQVLITFVSGNETLQSQKQQLYVTPQDITRICAGANVTVTVHISTRGNGSDTYLIAPGQCQDFTPAGQTLSQVSIFP